MEFLECAPLSHGLQGPKVLGERPLWGVSSMSLIAGTLPLTRDRPLRGGVLSGFGLCLSQGQSQARDPAHFVLISLVPIRSEASSTFADDGK